MPHKRSKQSVRVKQRKEAGSDHAPAKSSLDNEAIPKSVARVLNAVKVREDFKKRKRDGDEDEQDGKRRRIDGNAEKKEKLKIQPGESMQHFNKRVEDDLRPLVKSAAQAAKATMRNAIREEVRLKKEKKNKSKAGYATEKTAKEASPEPSPPPSKHAGRPKEFEKLSTSVPRRLNDIAQAPPEFKKLPRGATANATGKREGVLSMVQKSMMEKEREKAIARYRELKASRRRDADDCVDKE